MKVIYYSYSWFADCDFPLVKTLQNNGVDVRYYMPLPFGFKRSMLFDLEKSRKDCRLIKASKLREMKIFEDCIDLDKLYFISGFVNRKWFPFSWLLWLRVIIHMKKQKADVFHYTWNRVYCFEKLFDLFRISKKKIMTVHDPFIHLGVPDRDKVEKLRIEAFSNADNLILLNDKQVDGFCKQYGIQKNKIKLARLGVYDSITHVIPRNEKIDFEYILFFGQICEYKGVEYLLEAMKTVHSSFPNVKLIVAGGGKWYFDIEPYLSLSFIEFRHRFVGIAELSYLIENTLFAVCPYSEATQSGVVQTAFSMLCPLIVTDTGALADSVSNGVTGLIVPPRDSKSLADAICHLLENPDLLRQIKVNIEEVWYPANSWAPIAKTYESAYKSVMLS